MYILTFEKQCAGCGFFVDKRPCDRARACVVRFDVAQGTALSCSLACECILILAPCSYCVQVDLEVY